MGNSTQTSAEAPFNEDDVYDIFSIGFGPAALAIAIALNEHPNAKDLKAHFIELQPEFGWHKGMLIPGYRMQVSFLKDLVTLRDPTSKFTFLNFMHKTGRLVDFFNLYTFLPLRTEWNDYMAWCAGHFKDQVSYSTVGLNVEPYFPPGSDTQTIDILKVTYKNIVTGEQGYALTRNLIIATGAQAKMPALYPKDHPRVRHSSEYLSTQIPKDVKRIAIIGAGQSASEIFKDTSTRYPEADTRLFFRASALRSAETTGFVNELYNPEAVDRFFNLTETQRIDLLEEIRCTNYSVVHETLLKDLFQLRYVDDATGKRGKHILVPKSDIIKVDGDPSSTAIKLTIKNLLTGSSTTEEFDYLFVGVGYQRSAQLSLLQTHFSDALFPLSVRRDYSVWSKDPNLKAGIYLQGMTEGSHGMSDSVLSVMSVRGMEVVESVLKRRGGEGWSDDEKVNKVQVTSRADGLVWGI